MNKQFDRQAFEQHIYAIANYAIIQANEVVASENMINRSAEIDEVIKFTVDAFTDLQVQVRTKKLSQDLDVRLDISLHSIVPYTALKNDE